MIVLTTDMFRRKSNEYRLPAGSTWVVSYDTAAPPEEAWPKAYGDATDAALAGVTRIMMSYRSMVGGAEEVTREAYKDLGLEAPEIDVIMPRRKPERRRIRQIAATSILGLSLVSVANCQHHEDLPQPVGDTNTGIVVDGNPHSHKP